MIRLERVEMADRQCLNENEMIETRPIAGKGLLEGETKSMVLDYELPNKRNN